MGCLKYKTLYQLVRYRLKAKLKVPRPRSRKQQEQRSKLAIITSVITSVLSLTHLETELVSPSLHSRPDLVTEPPVSRIAIEPGMPEHCVGEATNLWRW